MSWQTNPITIKTRSFARSLGLTKMIGKLLQGERYEQAFDDAMFAAIRQNDVVWDVGANIGYYSKKFAKAAGPGGKVFAFEPFPKTISRLKSQLEGYETVVVVPMALGSDSGTVRMQDGGDDLGATNKIVGKGTVEGFVEVEVITGDGLVDRDGAQRPNILKVDTEGFELDVLQGMKDLLQGPELRALFIEVHFSNLAERGMPYAPATIEEILSASGYRLRWLDPSHLAAYRK
jgi:FkbM family methyltransferase